MDVSISNQEANMNITYHEKLQHQEHQGKNSEYLMHFSQLYQLFLRVK